MSIQYELESELTSRGADVIRFVDISQLSGDQNREYPTAILIGMILSKDFIKQVSSTPHYVRDLIRDHGMADDAFSLKEKQTDRLADFIAEYLVSKGFSAYSQSEEHLEKAGVYDPEAKQTPLPHKTIAGMAGLGWIGKHDLLVTPEYGSAISMCTVLTDVPLRTILHEPSESRCGDCRVCVDICPVNAITGNAWSTGASRDDLVDVSRCTTCLECMVHCPWTQAYVNGSMIR